MTEMANGPAHRFTLGGALGFGFEVLRARPKSVLFLLIGQTLIYVVMSLGQFMLLGHMARQGIQAAETGEIAAALALSMQFSSVSSLLSFLGIPVWIWMEAVWLTLYMSGRFTLWPGWAGLGRLALSWLILFGVYLVAFFAVFFVILIGGVIAMLAAETGTGDSSVAAMLVVFTLSLIVFVGMVAALSVFSGLPAHALSGRFEIGAAVRTGWRHVMGLTTAWIIFSILYMLVMIVCYGAVALLVGNHVLSTFEVLMQDAQDPLLSMRLYAELTPGLDQAGVSALVLTPIMLFMGVIMMIGRGIGAKLALSMPDPEKKAD